MRVSVLVTAALLLAGCSHAISGQPGQTATRAPSPTAASAPAPPVSKPPAPAVAPTVGAAISDVIAWIEAGSPADAARYHSATRDGVTTGLGDNVAFSVAKVACTTDSTHPGGALACLVTLTHPPPRPATVYGAWQGGWVDFDGADLHVGSAHADPGPFANGDGPELPYGESLSFGDYRCRADHVGVFCVNYARRSAAGFAAAGIEPFGCLRSVPAPEGIGEQFSC